MSTAWKKTWWVCTNLLRIWNLIGVLYCAMLKTNNVDNKWIFYIKEIPVTFPWPATLCGRVRKNKVSNSFGDSGAKEIDNEIFFLWCLF